MQPNSARRRAAVTFAALSAIVIGSLAAVAAAPASAADTDIRINEIITNSGTDSIELTNVGDEPVDVSGWIVKDDNDTRTLAIAAGTVVDPGGFEVVPVDVDGGFGLGNGDAARIYLPGGTVLIDGHTFPSHSSPSWSRCPDGTGAFVTGQSITLGAANDCPTVDDLVINEVESSGGTPGDWIELANPTALDLDASGLRVKDDDDGRTFAVPAGTTVPAGSFVAVDVDVDGGFGLGGADSARLFTADGNSLIDSYTWTVHAPTTYGRCPDFIGGFAETVTPTRGAANDCPLPDGARDVRINEIITDSDTSPDSIELTTTGAADVDVSGWILRDNNDAANHVLPAETVVPAGGYLAVATSFGLGNGDAARLYLPDGVTLVDGHTFPSHSNPSWSRCPDGTGDFVQAAAETLGTANDCTVTPPPALDPNWDDIEINEIASLNDDDPGNPGFSDAVELVNTGDQPVSIEGWWQADDRDAAGAEALALADLKVRDGDSFVPAPSWTIPAGGYVAFSSTKGLSGEGDAVKLWGPGNDPAARQLVDHQAYGDGDAGISDTYDSDARAFAACPDGSDEFWRVTVNSFGQDNTTACETRSRRLDTPVVLNEVSNVAGKAELLNTHATDPVDIAGWELLDSTGDVVHTVPAATAPLAAGAFYLAEDVTGLESDDSLSIRDGEGSTVVAHTWHEDGIASYSRCEMFGEVRYVETPEATWGAPNACPGLDTEPWPGASEVSVVDAADAFTDLDANDEGDVSGASFDPTDPSVLWVAMNKGRLFRMQKVGGLYEAFPAWDGGLPLRFANGTGELDSEGVVIGPDGAAYVTSERDNTNSGISSNRIARYDVGAVAAGTTELVATHEWDVNAMVPTGTNLGLEGITYVPDAFLVESGWRVGGAPYAAGTYPTPGLFVVAVEGTGDLHFFSLATGAEPVLVKTEASGFPFAMDVTYDADRRVLWALCDDSCGGVYNVLDVAGGDFRVLHSYARPAGMPDLNNEGMAIAPASTCVDGSQEVVWTDDGDTGGHSLRAGTLPCPTEEPPGEFEMTEAPGIDGRPRVGKLLTGDPGSWTPAPGTTAYRWLADGEPVPGATRTTLRLTPALVGARLTFEVTVAGDGLTDATAVSEPTPTIRKGRARLGVKVTPKRPTVREDRVRVRVKVTNVDGIEAEGAVTVRAGKSRPRTVELVDGAAAVRLPVFRRVGQPRVRVRYHASDVLLGVGKVVRLRVVR